MTGTAAAELGPERSGPNSGFQVQVQNVLGGKSKVESLAEQ